MTPLHLRAVSNDSGLTEEARAEIGESATGRVRRLQQEAHRLALEQIRQFEADLEDMANRAAEIAEGGEAYPVGVRELASRLAEELPHKVQAMAAIMARVAED